MTCQNYLETARAGFRGNFIALNAYTTEEETQI